MVNSLKQLIQQMIQVKASLMVVIVVSYTPKVKPQPQDEEDTMSRKHLNMQVLKQLLIDIIHKMLKKLMELIHKHNCQYK